MGGREGGGRQGRGRRWKGEEGGEGGWRGWKWEEERGWEEVRGGGREEGRTRRGGHWARREFTEVYITTFACRLCVNSSRCTKIDKVRKLSVDLLKNVNSRALLALWEWRRKGEEEGWDSLKNAYLFEQPR